MKINIGYEILNLEKRIVNGKSRLFVNVKCNKHNKLFWIRWDAFKQSNFSCKDCINEKDINKLKEKYEDILEKRMPLYTFINVLKENNKNYIIYQCDKGHILKKNLNDQYSISFCKECRKNNKVKHNIKYKRWNKSRVQELYNSYDLKILNIDDFKNAHSKLYAKVHYYDSSQNIYIQIADVFSNFLYSNILTNGKYDEKIKELKNKGYILPPFVFPQNKFIKNMNKMQ